MNTRSILVIAATVICWQPLAQAEMTYYLVAQWVENGNRFCRYGDGTVLNVGYHLCPLSIKN